MLKSVRWTLGALLVATSFLSAATANAQTNVAAISNNPLAQGYASDIGFGSSVNGPLDGNTSGGYDFHSANSGGSWWYVDLAQNWSVSSMTFYNRTGCCWNRASGAQFELWGSVPTFLPNAALFTAVLDGSFVQTFTVPNVTARYASVHAANCGDCYLNFSEVEVNALPVTATPEPASTALLATGLVGVFAVLRRKRIA
jgi:hypothetical protein